MATPNTPSPSIADAEPRPAPDADASAAPLASHPLARQLGMGYWLEYVIIGASIAMSTGLLMLLFWNGGQDNLALLTAGFVLFLVGFLAWWGMFLFLTWRLARWFGPPLLGRLRKGVRNLYQKDGPVVDEN